MIYKFYYWLEYKLVFSYHYKFRKNKNWLKEKLISEKKMRWLDLGSSTSFNEGFLFSDIIPEDQVPENMREHYIFWNAIFPLTEKDKLRIGKMDMIRMQHVFEHFSPEDGIKVIQNAFELLTPGGFLLITVPDLKKFVSRYQRKALNYSWSFSEWAHTRISKDSPQSFYFSIFTHSVQHQSHLWCYDKKGMEYQISKSINPKSIEFLSIFNNKSNIPFTHNRPLEDLCVLIQK